MRAYRFHSFALALCALLTGTVVLPSAPAWAEPVFGGQQPVTVAGLEFRLGPIVMMSANGNLSMQVAMTATSREKTPISIFIEGHRSSIVTDTGIVFNYDIANAAGVGVCSLDRQSCIQRADEITVDVYPGVPDHMTFSVLSLSGVSHTALAQTGTVNVSIVFCVRKPGNSVSFIPVTFENVRIKNMIQ